MFALFLTSKISPLHVGYKSPTKAFNGDFRLNAPLLIVLDLSRPNEIP